MSSLPSAESVDSYRATVEWMLHVAASPQVSLVVLGLLLIASLWVNVALVRRFQRDMNARLIAYGEAYEWIKGHVVEVHNLSWRLLSELRHQINMRGVVDYAKRSRRLAEFEQMAISVLYQQPPLPIVKDHHLKAAKARELTEHPAQDSSEE